MARKESELSGKTLCVRDAGDAARINATASSSWSARFFQWSLVLGFVLSPAPVFALLITLSFESIAGSVPLTGAGTNNATLNFGHVSAFEPLTTGVTRTVGASSYTISTHFGVRSTHLLALLSPNYTLQARLQAQVCSRGRWTA